ncbi:hypothetical protein CALCODRAFT_504024 [Calocera cornea HHB12733]|uniref:Uncharacterized protein n=1 Tax=Calocera cornea HHB12733 TaxID=1353952 RepID=A0A165CM77_9BASI|nr:hypothetical protein CALCODRAFT_504024 [Calocera cornea HHB12733]
MSTLSSVVSKLVRASHGSAIPDSVPDEELDRVVAELILKEAREKEAKYGKDGVAAYLPNGGVGDNNLPKANKRFLSAMLRNVDEHNATVIRQQQLAADLAREEHERAEVWERIRQDEEREERLDHERKDRKRKDADQAKDRMRRLLGSNLRREPESSKSGKERQGREDAPRSRDYHRSSAKASGSGRRDDDDRDRRRRHDEYDSSPRPHKRRGEEREYDSSPPPRKPKADDDQSPRRHSRSHRHRERDHSPPRRKRRELASDEDEDVWRPSKRRSRSRERTKKDDRASVSKSEASSSKSALPLHPALLDLQDEPVGPTTPPMSKMDRYFDEAYDPRLDIQVSKEGYIEPGQFEGWDQMLEVLKLRKEEKRLKEWERAAQEYAEDRKGKKKRSKLEREREREIEEHGKPIKELLEENRRKLAEMEGKEKGLLDVVYKKRGEAREWDKGKVAF